MAQATKAELVIVGTQYPPAEDLTGMTPKEREHSAVVTRQCVSAEYYKRGDSHYFFYEEPQEDVSAPVKTRIKCRAGLLEMTRRGGVESRMVFEAGKRHSAEYPTPYGKLFLDVVTEQVTVEEPRNAAAEPVCPVVNVKYVLESGGGQMGTYLLQIKEI